jgi:hypothetical protein
MAVVVDTNVPVAANGRDTHADAACVTACARELRRITTKEVVVLDEERQVLKQYLNNLGTKGQPGPGDVFLKWVLVNLANRSRISLTSIAVDPSTRSGYACIPDRVELARFDRSDYVFLALAVSHPDKPAIVNATDSDWAEHWAVMKTLSVVVKFLCPHLCGPEG